MGRPERLLIQHESDPDGRFHHVGRAADGRQFLAFVTGAFPYDATIRGQRFDGEKNWLAVVHTFGPDGEHLATHTRFGGSDARDGRMAAGASAWDQLGGLLSEVGLEGATLCNISVGLFEILRDGVLYGLIYEAYEDDGDEQDHVMLEPNDVMFHPPWDSGQFST